MKTKLSGGGNHENSHCTYCQFVPCIPMFYIHKMYLNHIPWNCMYVFEGISGYKGGLTLNQNALQSYVPKSFQCRNQHYAYANRLKTGQPPSNSATGLRSNLFATRSIIPHQEAEFKGFKMQTTSKFIFRKLPSIQRVIQNVTIIMMKK